MQEELLGEMEGCSTGSAISNETDISNIDAWADDSRMQQKLKMISETFEKPGIQLAAALSIKSTSNNLSIHGQSTD